MHLSTSLLVAHKERPKKQKQKKVPENMSMGKTYFIRKVGGGRGSSRTLKKKKQVLVSFPHSATPLYYTSCKPSVKVPVQAN